MDLQKRTFPLAFLVLAWFAVLTQEEEGLEESPSGGDAADYPYTIAVHIAPQPGGDMISDAKDIASKYDLTYIGKVGNLDDIHLFEMARPGPGVLGAGADAAQHLRNHRDVAGGRGTSGAASLGGGDAVKAQSSVMETAELLLMEEAIVEHVHPQKLRERVKRSSYSAPTDPMWRLQWSLLNTGQVGSSSTGHDINVVPAWIQGITGSGVVVGIVDDGLMYAVSDIKPNYDSDNSYDYVDNDPDPTPGVDGDTMRQYGHGTSCAGVVAMAKDNELCGTGVAFGSKVAGIRVIGSQGMTDAAEAMALGHNTDGVHIYSCSWGPPDNGYAVEGPGPLLEAVLEKGAREGRGGKGSIYVWATGNGGQHGDSCALDGYISSIYTIGIGGANQNAYPAYYDEQCSSKMAVTFNDNSFSSKSAKDITTLDADGQCIHHFTGTSASCPLASGTFALALQANPTLTWRDLQYLVVYTSNPNPFRPSTTANWKRNGAGLYVNHRFGFGAIDAEALVTRARNWITVPTQHSYTHTAIGTPRIAEFGWPLTKTFRIPGNCGIRFLEHVVLKISLELKGEFDLYSYSNYSEADPPFNHNQAQRGQVSITLTSPQETVSTLLPSREKDFINSEGFDSWPFMSVHHWGEDPKGDWTLKVHYRSSSGCVSVTNATVVLYGTKRRPKAVRGMPRDCDASCARNCSRRGNQFCDACTDLRNSTTLECTNSCASDFNSENGYCIDPLETISYAYTPPAHLLDDATPSSSISSVSVTTTTCLVPSTTVPVTSSVDSVVLSTSDSKQTHITPTSTQAQPHTATVVAPPQPTYTITATPVSSLEAGLDALEESTDFVTSLVGSESESPSTSSSPVSSLLSPFLQSSPSRTLAVAPSPTNGPLVSSTSSFPSLHFMVLLLSLLSTLLSFTLS